jgi:hypothetical protein
MYSSSRSLWAPGVLAVPVLGHSLSSALSFNGFYPLSNFSILFQLDCVKGLLSTAAPPSFLSSYLNLTLHPPGKDISPPKLNSNYTSSSGLSYLPLTYIVCLPTSPALICPDDITYFGILALFELIVCSFVPQR